MGQVQTTGNWDTVTEPEPDSDDGLITIQCDPKKEQYFNFDGVFQGCSRTGMTSNPFNLSNITFETASKTFQINSPPWVRPNKNEKFLYLLGGIALGAGAGFVVSKLMKKGKI